MAKPEKINEEAKGLERLKEECKDKKIDEIIDYLKKHAPNAFNRCLNHIYHSKAK